MSVAHTWFGRSIDCTENTDTAGAADWRDPNSRFESPRIFRRLVSLSQAV